VHVAAFNVKGAFRAPGIRSWGCSFYPAGAAASFLSRKGEGGRLLGAMLAAPLCLLLMRCCLFNAKFLAGAGVVAERGVLVRAWRAVLLFVRSLIRTDGTTNKNALG
jgi:hypothetical protein